MTRTTGSTRVQNGGSREADKFVVRFPENMRSRVQIIAQKERMSMNSYIIRALDVIVRLNEEEAGIIEATPSKPKLIMVGMACRYNGKAKIIQGLQVHESEEFVEALIDIGESQAWVPAEDLEAY